MRKNDSRQVLFLLFLMALGLTSCSDGDLKQQRATHARAADKNTPIFIGFVWPFSAEYDYLPEGVEMAASEINASGGLLGGREIRVVQSDDFDSVREGRLVAQELAENPDITAVIGHAWSYISVPAAPIYEFNGLIMLSPSSTSPELTRNGFNYIFRNLSSDLEVGRQLAIYADSQDYRRMMILYVNDPNGRQLSNVFENEADKLGISVLDRRSYRGSDRNFRGIIDQWKDQAFDAIFVAGSNPEASTFILQARQAGIEVPVIGSDGLDTSDLWNIAGLSANGTVVVSHYHPDNPRKEQQDFIKRFREKYGFDPDTWAAQGYDAMYLLANAISIADNTIPADVAAALHATQNWQGVTGPHTFDSKGDVVGKPIVLKVMQNGTFEFLELVTVEELSESPDIETTPEVTPLFESTAEASN